MVATSGQDMRLQTHMKPASERSLDEIGGEMQPMMTNAQCAFVHARVSTPVRKRSSKPESAQHRTAASS